ncbi:hypothetical protein BH10PLA2_BH10PLA2_36720 [soil metagenome]
MRSVRRSAARSMVLGSGPIGLTVTLELFRAVGDVPIVRRWHVRLTTCNLCILNGRQTCERRKCLKLTGNHGFAAGFRNERDMVTFKE